MAFLMVCKCTHTSLIILCVHMSRMVIINFQFIGMVKTGASLPFFALNKNHKDTQNSTSNNLRSKCLGGVHILQRKGYVSIRFARTKQLVNMKTNI